MKKRTDPEKINSAVRLSDALGEVDASLIAETDEKRQNPAAASDKTDAARRAKRRKAYRIAIAAAAAFCLTFAAIKIVPGLPMRVCALETAEYPEMAPYPTLAQNVVQGVMSGFDFSAARRNWIESRFSPRDTESRTSVSSALYAFAARTLPFLLTPENGENAVCSPVNVLLSSAMLAEITAGDSRAELLSLLGAEDITDVRALASAAWRECYSDDGACTVIPASSLWLGSGLSPDSAVLKTLADTYFASSFSGRMGGAALNAALRGWLDDQTGGFLSKETKKQGFTDEDCLAIASTLQFRGKWVNPFKSTNTKDGIFHSPVGDVTCSFLHKNRSAREYYWSGQFAAVSEPFEDSGTMWLILPDEGISPEALLSDPALYSLLSDPYSGSWGSWDENGVFIPAEDALFEHRHLYVNLALPKFDVTGSTDLRQAFRSLGVVSVLSQETADFSPLSDRPDLFLSSAEHTARVAVDEDGCVAASFVVMKGAGSAAPPEDEVDFVLDRPFLFVITGYGNIPLYAGIVNQP